MQLGCRAGWGMVAGRMRSKLNQIPGPIEVWSGLDSNERRVGKVAVAVRAAVRNESGH